MRYKIEIKSKLNKADFDVLVDLMAYYDKYQYDAELAALESKIEKVYANYVKSLKEITDDAKNDIKENFRRNNQLIKTGKEVYYSWYEKKSIKTKLTKKDIQYYIQENKTISRINVKLTGLWLKLIKGQLVIRRI